MGGFGAIFSPKKLVDGLGKGFDKLVDGQGDKADRFGSLLESYEPFKLAQRVLAFMFSFAYLFVFVSTAIVHLIVIIKNIFWKAGLDTEPLYELYNWNNETLGYPVLIILTFYFSGGVINGALKRLNKSRKSTN
jgi:hypothetical protein